MLLIIIILFISVFIFIFSTSHWIFFSFSSIFIFNFFVCAEKEKTFFPSVIPSSKSSEIQQGRDGKNQVEEINTQQWGKHSRRNKKEKHRSSKKLKLFGKMFCKPFFSSYFF